MTNKTLQRTILITGCSSGIGLDAARGLHGRGWRVLATCRREEDCARLRAEGLESFPLDLDDETSVADGAAEALARVGNALDAVFMNGAFALPGAVEDLPRAGLRAIFETNLFGQVDLANRLIPAMRTRGQDGSSSTRPSSASSRCPTGAPMPRPSSPSKGSPTRSGAR